VETRKDALIVTDGAAATQELAEEIAAGLGDFKVLVKTASDFAGTDLLPAEIFFLGCEQPNPPSFAGIAELLRHINLAGRSCGVFSPGSGSAAAYLAGLVTDCEAALGEPFVAAKNKAGLKNWVKSILP
jgi:hypothetical protein